MRARATTFSMVMVKRIDSTPFTAICMASGLASETAGRITIRQVTEMELMLTCVLSLQGQPLGSSAFRSTRCDVAAWGNGLISISVGCGSTAWAQTQRANAALMRMRSSA